MDRGKHITALKTVRLVLQDTEVAEKGHIACIDLSTGELVAGQTGPDLFPIGYFKESFTGDGEKKILVELFEEIWLHWFDNDDTDTIEAGDVGNVVYVKDSRTVYLPTDSTGASALGICLAVNATNGVGVWTVRTPSNGVDLGS